MATARKTIQNRKDIQAYRERQRQMMYELWRKSEQLAELTGNLQYVEAEAQQPARIQAVLRLLDCLIADLQRQQAEEIVKHEQEFPEF